jgi:hypothetical protein
MLYVMVVMSMWCMMFIPLKAFIGNLEHMFLDFLHNITYMFLF